ncbi:hypothetical protein FQN57_002878 [Myotisia sp. PD_48]|nr:hypothetical protein FQN57_002878 [Myotisia sp. PD_48]
MSSESFHSRRAGASPLSLDLSSLPPPSRPAPASNTLLITELHDLSLFQPSSLDAIKARITAIAPLNSFSPLPSFRRIVCSFLSIQDAVTVRKRLDREPLLDQSCRTRVYFGEHTPLQNDAEETRKNNLLEAPHSQKLFFISPPPSPPHGWMMRNEEPPNKDVHAADLAEALHRLDQLHDIGSNHSMVLDDPRQPDTPISPTDVNMAGQDGMDGTPQPGLRSRSSTLIYDPEHHGNKLNLPAVTVEDTSLDPNTSDLEMDSDRGQMRVLAHTPRPPVELMD